jgi:hypothetical protein
VKLGGDDDAGDGGKGTDKGKPKRGPGRPPKRMPAPELERRIPESLAEVADWLDGGAVDVEVNTLADLIRRDAEKMAEVAAALAQRVSPVAWLVERLVGKAGPLSALRAFGPTVRRVLSEAAAKRRAALEQLERDRAAAPPEEPGRADERATA